MCCDVCIYASVNFVIFVNCCHFGEIKMNISLPMYLSKQCISASDADSRRHLRSANRHLLAVQRFRLIVYGLRAFSVAGPTVWNSLPDYSRDPTISADCFTFRRLLKIFCLLDTSASSALWFLTIIALYKSTYLLTYLHSNVFLLPRRTSVLQTATIVYRAQMIKSLSEAADD